MANIPELQHDPRQCSTVQAVAGFCEAGPVKFDSRTKQRWVGLYLEQVVDDEESRASRVRDPSYRMTRYRRPGLQPSAAAEAHMV
jgi:hypothetical protein